jgi:four helix bundle protein
LTAHMRRAAISVTSHIVEGCVRDSQAGYLRFLYRALGSLREPHYQISLSQRVGFVLNDNVSLIEPTIIETEKVLNGLIK